MKKFCCIEENFIILRLLNNAKDERFKTKSLLNHPLCCHKPAKPRRIYAWVIQLSGMSDKAIPISCHHYNAMSAAADNRITGTGTGLDRSEQTCSDWIIR